jgi:hypothetical protein
LDYVEPDAASGVYAETMSLFVRVPQFMIVSESQVMVHKAEGSRDKVEARNTTYREELGELGKDENWRKVDRNGRYAGEKAPGTHGERGLHLCIVLIEAYA